MSPDNCIAVIKGLLFSKYKVDQQLLHANVTIFCCDLSKQREILNVYKAGQVCSPKTTLVLSLLSFHSRRHGLKVAFLQFL